LRGEDARVLVRVVDRDVPESERGLLPVLSLEVGTRAGVLDLDVLLLGLRVTLLGRDVADVAVEGRDHALLHLGRGLRLELLPLALRALAIGLRGALRTQALALPVRVALVHLVVHLLVAEHRSVRGLRRIRSLR